MTIDFAPTVPTSTVSMVDRVAKIMDAFGPQDDSVGISEIARRTGLAKSTVSRIAGELVDHRFLERTSTGVRLGLRLFELGESAARPRDLRKIAIASMSDLRAAVGLTVQLAVLERREVVYVEILTARGTPPLPSRIGGRMPAHATGVGKALLAWSPVSVVHDVIEAGLTKVGPATITEAGRFRRELAHVRATGIAYERNESATGISCAASAVRNSVGDPVAAISVAGWTKDIDVERAGLAVQTATATVSRLMARRPGMIF